MNILIILVDKDLNRKYKKKWWGFKLTTVWIAKKGDLFVYRCSLRKNGVWAVSKQPQSPCIHFEHQLGRLTSLMQLYSPSGDRESSYTSNSLSCITSQIIKWMVKIFFTFFISLLSSISYDMIFCFTFIPCHKSFKMLLAYALNL